MQVEKSEQQGMTSKSLEEERVWRLSVDNKIDNLTSEYITVNIIMHLSKCLVCTNHFSIIQSRKITYQWKLVSFVILSL